MRINKIYKTISGEVGIVIPQGSPCLVVRTQGCCNKCEYCDAPETQSFDGGTEISIDEIVDMAVNEGLPILLTGGEPLLQPDVVKFLNLCIFRRVDVQIETSGSVRIPKMSNDRLSFIVDYKSEEDFAVDVFSDLTTNDIIKFVVQGALDLIQAGGVIDDIREETSASFAISPVQGEFGDISAKKVSEYILDHKIPAILNVQLHKIIEMP